MNQIRIRNFQSEDEFVIIALQNRCVDYCPDTGKFEAGMWLTPGYENGKNVFIAEDANA